ncbi:MAG: hypothetical protein QF615_04330, partial [Planctomycetota bacterium]|nr:hypothetical protein [Planctomycetota bacterium]
MTRRESNSDYMRGAGRGGQDGGSAPGDGGASAGDSASGGAPTEPTAFVSRSAPRRWRPAPLAPFTCPDGTPLPSLRDRGLLALLLVVAVLAGFSWQILEGYQLADSVEYMERAQAFVAGDEVVDSEAIRSFGFIALLTPFFGLAELIGLE